ALADMSFHIRTPLSSILNLLFLLEKTSASSQQKEFIDGLKTSVDDLSIMIHNLLNFSVLLSENLKVEEEEMTFRDFFQSIQKVVRIKSDNAKVNLEYQIDKLAPTKLICDTNKLTQILYNLLDNSIKRSQENGAVRLEVKTRQKGENHHDLCISVIDFGQVLNQTAIKELQEADRLLEVYSGDQEADRKKQLGMAIVIKLIKTLGGYIEISSHTEVGTCFKLVIPVKVPKTLRISTSDKPEIPLKILLVEDHFLNQIATKKVLTAWSNLVSVDIAENGLIGVEKFREHGYDLILMDMQMPVMNGLEAARKIRENSKVPIVALTANSSKQEADKCREIGINDYIAKPFKPQDLYAKIMSLLVMVSSQN
ncbi:MAG: response regulator, partial [Bacteroidota bacterium]